MTMTTLTPVTCAEELKDSLSLLEGRFAESTIETALGLVSYRSCGSGTGPVVVLLHGISSGAASWLQCALRLEKDAHVIAWNAPGYGRSTALPQERPTAADYAQQLDAFLQALGIIDCVLVGHSLGAMMAAAYAGGGYRRAAKIVLMSPALGYGSAARRVRGQQIAQERLDTLRTIGVDGMAQRSPARMLSAQASDAQRAWVRWNIQWLNPQGYTQAVHLLCGDDLRRYVNIDGVGGDLAHAKPDALAAVYCGADDVVTTPADSRALAEDLQIPFRLIDRAGHACYIEQAGAVAAAIRGHFYQFSQIKTTS